jgi:ubiquinol-cytochrome c reductase cytochrome b subunit
VTRSSWISSDKASLQNGAKTYMNYCMGCHSLKYARYNRVAAGSRYPRGPDAGQPDRGPGRQGRLAHEQRHGQDRAKTWFGAAPPDLTLVARARQPDWLYTYLRTFYRDDSRPYGVNNLVFPNVGMPHVLLPLQGLMSVSPRVEPRAAPRSDCDSLEVAEAGSMTRGPSIRPSTTW